MSLLQSLEHVAGACAELSCKLSSSSILFPWGLTVISACDTVSQAFYYNECFAEMKLLYKCLSSPNHSTCMRCLHSPAGTQHPLRQENQNKPTLRKTQDTVKPSFMMAPSTCTKGRYRGQGRGKVRAGAFSVLLYTGLGRTRA